jgi:uncharacterized membrane protein YedE/YeeE
MSGGLLLALLIGVAFGAALEQAGLGNARKLSGFFYLTDFTVLKVMLSAILTAMLGAFWLGRLGLIDLGQVYVPETFLWPQLAGGLIFGLGFALAGLCPGTACVSAGSGRLDGLATVAGIFLGILATGIAFPLLERFYGSGARGVLTLPAVSGLPDGVVVLLVVLAALAVFHLIARREQRA